MTYAWYGHLKHRELPLLTAVLISWLVALPEYCLQVPANRFGYGNMSAFQLKILQEIITLCVFVAFARVYLGEELRWNYLGAFVCLLGAVACAFWKR